MSYDGLRWCRVVRWKERISVSDARWHAAVGCWCWTSWSYRLYVAVARSTVFCCWCCHLSACCCCRSCCCQSLLSLICCVITRRYYWFAVICLVCLFVDYFSALFAIFCVFMFAPCMMFILRLLSSISVYLYVRDFY